MIDHEVIEPVDLAARLMEIDSTSGREGAVIDWMQGFLAGRDWNARRIPVSPGRDDVFIWIRCRRSYRQASMETCCGGAAPATRRESRRR
jgi:hypothetical protein